MDLELSLSHRTSSTSHTQLHQKVVQPNMFVGCLFFLIFQLFLFVVCFHFSPFQVFHSFPLAPFGSVVLSDDGRATSQVVTKFDAVFLLQRVLQYKEIFSSYEVIGFYDYTRNTRGEGHGGDFILRKNFNKFFNKNQCLFTTFFPTSLLKIHYGRISCIFSVLSSLYSDLCLTISSVVSSPALLTGLGPSVAQTLTKFIEGPVLGLEMRRWGFIDNTFD